MDVQVSWQVELAVKPGELENLRALTSKMVASTRGEVGVLVYERFISEDGQVVHLYERYADSAAAVAHLRTFQHKFGGAFMGMVERKRFTVYGSASAELREILDRIGVTYFGPFDGFSQFDGVRLKTQPTNRPYSQIR